MSSHKVTCGVRLDVLDRVLASIKADLAAGGVRYRLVVSGSGDWRFVDLVPAEAGKLQVGAEGRGAGLRWGGGARAQDDRAGALGACVRGLGASSCHALCSLGRPG